MPTIAGFLITNFANADRIIGFNEPHLGGLDCHEAELIISSFGTTGHIHVDGGEALMLFKPKIGWPGTVYLTRKESETLEMGRWSKITLQLVYKDTP